MKKIYLFQSFDQLLDKVLSTILKKIKRKEKQGEIFRLALSGGETPIHLYQKLSKEKSIHWSSIEIFLVDERRVPMDDPRSNFRMIQKKLLLNLKTQPKKVVYFNTKLFPTKALLQVEQQFENFGEPFFDLVILGIGKDGHTASLFPKSAALSEEIRWVAETVSKDSATRKRFTLTYPALESSRSIFFLLRGREKLPLLSKLKKSSPFDIFFPAARLFHRRNASVFFSVS